MMRVWVCLLVVLFTTGLLAAQDGSISFSADRMSGTSGKKDSITLLEGNAKVQLDTLTITGDRIELSGKDFRHVLAEGNISGEDPEKGFSFSSDRLTYDRETEIATFQGNATLLDTENDVATTAGLISYNQKTEVALLQIRVTLKRGNIESVSGFAVYRRTLSRLELSGSPRVKRSGDEFAADRIMVDLETDYISLDGSVSGTLQDAEEATGAGDPAEAAEAAAAEDAGDTADE